MIGETFERLTVESFSHKDARSRKWWVCRCSCGNATTLHTGNLRSGNTKSCGCLVKDAAANRRISRHHSDITAVILGYKRHANDRGLSWEMSREQVEATLAKDCFYCGSPPSNIKQTKNTITPFRYSGLDRVDNALGYLSSNVVPCCRICNRAKQAMSLNEFAEWAGRLASRADQWGGLFSLRQEIAA